jgi:outer membrane cobalamin receptor
VDSDFSSLEPALTESEGHRWWTARATCAITRQLTVLAAVDNVLDSHHMEPLGYPVLGRAIRLGARVTF